MNLRLGVPLVVALAPIRSPLAQTTAVCNVRGTVESDAGVRIPRADITALQDGQMRVALSDSSGAFGVTLTTGRATLVVRAIGFAMQRRVLTIVAPECERVAIRLTSAVELPAMRASGARLTPPTRGAVRADDPTIARPLNRVGLGAAQAASLSDMLASTPGVAGTGDFDAPGFSVLALPNDQSVTTLNGARVDADQVPSQAGVLARVSTSPFDVSHGGFSGGELALLTAPAGGSPMRNLAAGTALVPLSTAALMPNLVPVATTSGLASGSAPGGLVSYRLSWDAAQRSAPGAAWSDIARRMAGAGPSIEALGALTRVARADGLPSADAFLPGQRNRNGSAMLRADAADWRGTHVDGSMLASWRAISGVSSSGFGSRAHSADDLAEMQAIQLGATTTLDGGPLNEVTATAVRRLHRSFAESMLPDIGVVLGGDVRSVEATAWLGGNAALPRDTRTRSLEVSDELSDYVGHQKHLLKLSVSGIRSILDDASNPGNDGAYSYASVADFIANVPAEYTWWSVAPASASRELFAASLGDQWLATPSLALQLGTRVDADALSPNQPQAVRWGVSSVAASPRLGFSWVPGRRDPREEAGPSGVILRGGAGRFTGSLPLAAALRVAAASSDAGEIQVVCVGPTSPVPVWPDVEAGAPAPQRCLGAASSASGQRTAVQFGPGFRAPSAWRAELGGSFPAHVRVDVDATYSLGMHNTAQVAGNLRSTAAATLADEGARAVLADVSRIDPRTGIPQPNAGLSDTILPGLFEIRSDMRSRAAQLTAGIAPERQGRVDWQITYTYQRAMEQAPVLDFLEAGHRSAGDKVGYLPQWSAAQNQMRHQVVASSSIRLWRTARLSASYVGRSGLAYTPVVAGDIDADGLAGDAAFIFDPARTTDAALAASMRDLLARAPRSARRCLAAQLQRVAARNSCVGEWSGDASAEVVLPAETLRLWRLTSINLQVINLLAGADALLHGLERSRGWGSGAAPDPVLLRPVGFDPTSQSYKYSVNANFGSRLAQSAGLLAPFSVAVSARVVVGSDPDRRRLAALIAGRPLDSAVLARRLSAEFGHAGVNPLAVLLGTASLQLADSTKGALAKLVREASNFTDSLWGALAAAMLARSPGSVRGQMVSDLANPSDTDGRSTGHPAESNGERFLASIRAARDADFRELGAVSARAMALLTPTERERLPLPVRATLDPGAFERQRALAAERGRGG